MNENKVKPSTTKESHVFIQGENSPLSDINFSINCSDNLDPDEVYRPMLDSSRTRPMQDCGKADDNLEG